MAPSNGDTAPSPAFVSEGGYLAALSRFIRTHESALAAYYAPQPRQKAAPPPSWTTVLTLGIVPTTDSASSPSPPPRRDPFVLKFDPHHLYYLLLKFDELGISGAGELDVAVEGGTTRPMSVDYSSVSGTPGRAGSLLGGLTGGGMLGFPSKNGDDARSVRSGISSFSFGSGWWGLGGGAQAPTKDEEAANVRYIYSCCTKLPALKLAPFHLVAAEGTPALACAVEGFVDCPPPATCVPLHAFKNLQALVLEDLDPRGFLGWDVLAVQLRSLEVRRGGIEDVGELICDAPCEDLARRVEEERRNRPVGTQRRRRAAGLSESSLPGGDEDRPVSPSTAPYPAPPRLAWSSLRHLSLVDNSLTFVPSPPMTFLPALTSLDLSSNLLISIPPALAHLTSLRSLNLSDNMIDSLLGVAKALGAITALNLSRNRLENLSGLDRLAALERLDVRDNALTETLEVSRVACLPLLREVYVRGNPFTRARDQGGDDAWRVKSFGYFAEEDAHGHRDALAGDVRIDGLGISGSERRAVEAELARRGTPVGRHRRASAGVADRPATVSHGQHKVIVGRRVVTAPHRPHRTYSPPPSLPSQPAPPSVAPDGALIDSSNVARPKSPTKSKARRHKPRRIVDLDADPSHPPTLGASSAVLPHVQSDSDHLSSSGAERSSTSRPAAVSADPTSSEGQSSPPAAAARPSHSSDPSSRAQARRERLTASAFDPPESTGTGASNAAGGEALRRRIEALREEVGESWLSVLGEREARERERRETPVPALAPEAPKAPVGGTNDDVRGEEWEAHAPTEEPTAQKARHVVQERAEPPPAPDPAAATASAPVPSASPAPTEGVEAVAAVPTVVKSVRKKKAKGGRKKGAK
ncbi:hypothetical protein JCM3770_004727 [Rhodotorula araucariae]